MNITIRSVLLILLFFTSLLLFLKIVSNTRGEYTLLTGLESEPTDSWLEEDSEAFSATEVIIDVNVKEHSETVSGNTIQNIEETDTDFNGLVNTEQLDNDEAEKRYERLLGCRKLPDILTIGFEKCGTVTLDTYLGIHPQIFIAYEGNYELFNKDSTVSVQDYTRKKPCTPQGKFRLNKLATPGTTEKTYKVIPNAKLLAIVRDPVDRAMSHYIHRLDKGLESTQSNFDRTIASIMDYNKPFSVKSSILFSQSRFLEELEPWIANYGLDKIHIVDGDNFVKNPVQELQKVERFLGLKPFITEDHFVYSARKRFYCLKENNNAKCMPPKKGRPHPQMSNETRSRLQEYFKPLNENLFMTIGMTFSWNY